MPKFTKSQQAILDAVEAKGRTSVCRIGGRGQEGGRISGGIRETNAALSLCEKGFLERTSVYRSSDSNHGYTIFSTDITVRKPQHAYKLGDRVVLCNRHFEHGWGKDRDVGVVTKLSPDARDVAEVRLETGKPGEVILAFTGQLKPEAVAA